MTQETWLLTGGAGYIGAHIADEFIRAGKSVVIYDSLYQGLELLAGRRAWEAENGPSPKKSRKKAAKAKPGATAPTLTKNTVKKAATKKKAAKKASGKAKS
jgi:nucleoside-diphosphate-sugar epimerase